MRKSLLEIEHLDPENISYLLTAGTKYRTGQLPVFDRPYTVASLFYENSTRTLISFELAAKRLGLAFINVDIAKSSTAKGETFQDTLATLHAMNIDGFILRHSDENLIKNAQTYVPSASIINAGSGMHAHPTQALADGLTLKENFHSFSDINVVIVGDVRHSRVANSLIALLKKLQVNRIVIAAPAYFLPKVPFEDVLIEPDLDKALQTAQVVYTLRVQKERFSEEERCPLDEYIKNYGLTLNRLKLAGSDPLLMHPGPVNRNIEIASDVLDQYPYNKILNQVQNGVYARMAVYEWLFSC